MTLYDEFMTLGTQIWKCRNLGVKSWSLSFVKRLSIKERHLATEIALQGDIFHKKHINSPILRHSPHKKTQE